jgi:hypothetical protein
MLPIAAATLISIGFQKQHCALPSVDRGRRGQVQGGRRGNHGRGEEQRVQFVHHH